ncbi:MAG: aldolase/citrate lyase family protein [Bacteroidales bacterium]|jgi:citrate lyase subunit beta/citryl-CoA lyase|nr:aldolase/citrate lyase family protein [Bacteroidales bacterium]
MSKIATAGNAGPKVRSDCEITIEIRQKGGIAINLKSKVKTLYGESIKSLCREVLDFFRIRNAVLSIDDSGALPLVIAARLEAAIRKITGTEMEFLPEMIKENLYATTPERTRFSRLYLPGNSPGLMINAGLHSSHGIILDLEDSVAPDKKDEARVLVRNALRQIDFRGAERMVRINQGETGLKDLQCVVPHNVNLVLVPKCETAEQVRQTQEWINEIRSRKKIRNRIFLMPIVESAMGIENCSEIARASDDVVALVIGLEDFTADMGVQRTQEGAESLYARSRLVIAAKAAGIQPIDSVFSDVGDLDGLKQNVLRSKALGFEGMGCIHPRQIRVINEGYSPDNAEIDKSIKIVLAFEEASKNGLGVVALGTKMIDAPVVKRALKTIALAEKSGLIGKDWRGKTDSNQ